MKSLPHIAPAEGVDPSSGRDIQHSPNMVLKDAFDYLKRNIH